MDPNFNQQPNQNPSPAPPANNSNDPIFHAPFNSPVQNQQPQPTVSPPSQTEEMTKQPRGKLFIILCVLGGVVLLLIIFVLILVAATHKKAPAKPAGNGSQSSITDAATSTNVQIINDTITQDLSSLNDDQDFPPDKLTDKTLNL